MNKIIFKVFNNVWNSHIKNLKNILKILVNFKKQTLIIMYNNLENIFIKMIKIQMNLVKYIFINKMFKI
jgi:hypothetical protein